MIFFEASLEALAVGPNPVQERGDHNSFNDIIKHLHPSNADEAKSLLAGKRGLISDLLASLVAQYYVTRHIDRKELVRNCMDVISENVHNLGALEVPKIAAIAGIAGHDHIKAIVFGYQDTRGLERRVRAFVQLVGLISARCDALFVGAFSSSMGSRIPSETNKMITLFDHICKEEGVNPSLTSIETEDKSKNTIENLQNAIKQEFIAKRSDKKKQCLVLVSSSFHLIRIVEALKALMSTGGLEAQDQKFLSDNIDKIYLIGAEDSATEFAGRDVEYIKNMMFDIFRKNLK